MPITNPWLSAPEQTWRNELAQRDFRPSWLASPKVPPKLWTHLQHYSWPLAPKHTKTITTPSCTAMIATCRHALPRPLNKFETCPWHARREGSQIWCCHYGLAVPENGWENTRLSRRIIKTNQNHGKNHSYPTYPEKNWWLMWLQYPLLQWFTATRSIPEVVSPHSTCRGAHPPLWREDLQRRQSSKKMDRPTEKTLAKPQKMGTVFQWKTIYIKSWLKIDMTNCFF